MVTGRGLENDEAAGQVGGGRLAREALRRATPTNV